MLTNDETVDLDSGPVSVTVARQEDDRGGVDLLTYLVPISVRRGACPLLILGTGRRSADS